jgi:hypothetical protein
MGRWCAGIVAAAALLAGLPGCRSCHCADCYHTAIDHKLDYPMLFDTWYCPRLDVSRAGKPDWCGPVNRILGCRRCDCVNPWKQFDVAWLYPPRYPYLYPGTSFPGPSQSEVEPEFRDEYEREEVMPAPDQVPTPQVLPEPPTPQPPPDRPPAPEPPEAAAKPQSLIRAITQ